jgi:hypothetical protein
MTMRSNRTHKNKRATALVQRADALFMINLRYNKKRVSRRRYAFLSSQLHSSLCELQGVLLIQSAMRNLHSCVLSMHTERNPSTPPATPPAASDTMAGVFLSWGMSVRVYTHSLVYTHLCLKPLMLGTSSRSNDVLLMVPRPRKVASTLREAESRTNHNQLAMLSYTNSKIPPVSNLVVNKK